MILYYRVYASDFRVFVMMLYQKHVYDDSYGVATIVIWWWF